MESEHRVLRSRPRSFYLPSTESSQPGTPIVDESSPPPDSLDPKQDDLTSSRSMMNLTSPTLYGIYSPTAFGGVRDESGTPWDTGAQTPNLQHSPPAAGRDYFSPAGKGISEQTVLQAHVVKKHGFRGYVLPLIRRSVLLFLFGMAYGGIITHLHGHPNVAGRVPVNMEHIDLDQRSLGYLALWGVAGVALGSLQPWFDLLWGDDLIVGRSQNAARTAKGNGLLEWSPMVRSIGAFVGIAFAIRKLPWQSTLQVSLTLALANPVLWYLIDRSKPGFVLSTVVGITGMLALLGINPTIVPSPATASLSSPLAATSPDTTMNGAPIPSTTNIMGMTQESVAVGTWIASVLFCSCVCFGNIGRRLAD
ncbi:hypothetical protein CIHG_03552 [Coccidioides immitis H538.4]|uniref:INSIG domain-containing protein n=1 Tax=Coccidioides immitis H538.4 TaxID=396776 RepID=A0A0J8RN52_COCIT|nr:hypothetical protein CIHG_03552 [Coccidioides immitis H538.4]